MITDQLAPKFREAAEVFQPVIDTLISHYQGIERQDVEAKHLPQHQINEYLSQLDITYPNASPQKLRIAIRHFISELDCFRYRLVARDRDNHNVAIWDALSEPLTTFLHRHHELEIICRPSVDAYPPVDLIVDWINSQVSVLGG